MVPLYSILHIEYNITFTFRKIIDCGSLVCMIDTSTDRLESLLVLHKLGFLK